MKVFNVDGDTVHIGCQSKTITEWLSSFELIGESFNYSKKQIKEYGLYLKLAQDLLDL